MSHDPATIRILAVDDHPLRREGLAGLIADESNMTLVARAANGREPSEQVRSLRPDVALMDGVRLRPDAPESRSPVSSIEAAEHPERGRRQAPRLLWRSIVLVQEGR